MSKYKEYNTLEEFKKLVKSYNAEDLDKVLKAYNFAAEKHAGKTRESGAPYITHPLSVAYILAEMNADSNTLCAALLHDVVEDTDTTLDDIRREFNDDIAILVDGVTKISNTKFYDYKEELNNANIEKLLLSLVVDPRIVIIKLADRLHNMRTLKYKKDPGKRRIKALETLCIFVPLADRLGLYKMRAELEDLSFKELYEQEYIICNDQREKFLKLYRENVEEMKHNIKRILLDNDIDATVVDRVQNLYSIYKKTLSGKKMEDIHDLIAVKVLNNNILDCYKSREIINQNYDHLEESKDYIMFPKVNLYQSLQIFIKEKMPSNPFIQVRIRTHEQDLTNGIGIASYWKKYKGDAKEKMKEALKKLFPFYNSIIELNDEFDKTNKFVEAAFEEIFNEKIYVQIILGKSFDFPYGARFPLELPVGSTIVDAAFAMGDKLGQSVVGAMINNNLAIDLEKPLDTGDIIELIVDSNIISPQREWLDSVKTTRARVGIRKHFKK